jgi:hypothetical protein
MDKRDIIIPDSKVQIPDLNAVCTGAPKPKIGLSGADGQV